MKEKNLKHASIFLAIYSQPEIRKGCLEAFLDMTSPTECKI
jgi:hypothetical protein